MSIKDGYIYRLERRATWSGEPVGDWEQATNREAYTHLNTIRALKTRYTKEYADRAQWQKADSIRFELRVVRFALNDGEVVE